MTKLYLSKHKNGYYYIYYIDLNGKRKSITTKTKVKSEALKALSNFDKLIKYFSRFLLKLSPLIKYCPTILLKLKY